MFLSLLFFVSLLTVSTAFRLPRNSFGNKLLSSLVVDLSSTSKKVTSSLLVTAFLLTNTLGLVPPAHAVEQVSFENKREHYALKYPYDWIENEATLSGERNLKVFQSPTDKTASVSVVYTPIPADFMRLSAFGDIQQYLIPKGDGINTKVISESTKGETYTLEYSSEGPGLDPPQPPRHVITVFALRPQEAVIGLTAQSSASTFDASKEAFTEIVKSLKTNL